jgi:Luciferase-like monooxygenase
MEFGIGIDTHIKKWDLVRYAEDLGYDRAWVPDSQMIWSDCYATLALAAANTRRIKIGTGVAIAGVSLTVTRGRRLSRGWAGVARRARARRHRRREARPARRTAARRSASTRASNPYQSRLESRAPAAR